MNGRRVLGHLALCAACIWILAGCTDDRRPTISTTAPDPQVGETTGEPARNPRPHLWVLSIGVSAYTDPRLHLRYAAADAADFAEVLKRQEHGPLYDEVHTSVLTDAAVTRESLLEAFDAFLGAATPVDVAVIFLAGHGVRTEQPTAHYFLTAAAAPAAPHIAGVDMEELRRQILRLHRNIPRMVVILDTCYAGAVAGTPSDSIDVGADLSSQLAAVDGLYILTAASRGQRSYELAAQRHGAFTFGLLDGLNGAASSRDGLITVYRLATHATGVVEQLTQSQQRPSISIVGEDFALAADPARFAQVTPPPVAVQTPSIETVARREKIAIGAFEYFGPDASYQWMHRALSQDVLTAFSELRQLDVYDEKMLRLMARDAPDVMDAAQRTDVNLVVQGAYWVQNQQLSISAQVQSVRPVRLVASARTQGPVDAFSQLTGQLMLALLDQLPVAVPGPLKRQLRNPGATSLTARRLLAEGEGEDVPATSPPDARPPTLIPPEARLTPLDRLGNAVAWMLQVLVQPSFAQDNLDPEGELRATLEGYRQALESEDIEALRSYYEDFTPGQATALSTYFENASALQVELTDVRIAISGNDAAVSFTRRDRFTDRTDGEPQDVRIRVTKRFERRAGRWVMLKGA